MFNHSARAGSKTSNCSSSSDGSVRLRVNPKPGCTIKDLHTTVKNGVCTISSKTREDDTSSNVITDTDHSIELNILGLRDLKIIVRNGTVEITNL